MPIMNCTRLMRDSLAFLCVASMLVFTANGVIAQEAKASKSDTAKAQAAAQEPAAEAASDDDSEEAKMPTEQELFDGFAKMLTKVRLVGHFTIDGRPMNDLNEESYEIRSAKKLPEKDTWLIASRIKYGKNDVTVPLILTVKWAGKTPMITLDEFTIPGMGTFSARVVFHDKKYAGTWTHDDVGGHLFGRIEPMDESKEETGSTDKPKQ
jgi:hypothetical protein